MSDPDDRQVQHTPAARLLGREILSSDAATGEVKLRFIAKPEFANRHGTVQGGFLAAMLDSAAGMAVMLSLPPEQTAVTTRLDVSYLKPASIGPLHATSRIVRRDARSADVEASLTNESGLVVATAKAELRIVVRKA